MNDAVMVHSGMTYQCEKCGKKWRMWLEDGVEKDNAEGKRQPCPFKIGCKCGGRAQHIDWINDIKLPKLHPIADHMSYFKFDVSENEYACGIPVIKEESENESV